MYRFMQSPLFNFASEAIFTILFHSEILSFLTQNAF